MSTDTTIRQETLRTQNIQRYFANRAHPTHISHRLFLEQKKEYAYINASNSIRNNIRSRRWWMNQALRFSGFRNIGRRNALAIEVNHNEIFLSQLPGNLSGRQILHLTDLHIESIDGLQEKVISSIRNIDPDITVITGDIRSRSFGPIEPSIRMMSRIMNFIEGHCYAVLGNHDSIHMAPELEKMGIRVLMNESVTLEFNDNRIAVIGVDDPSDYKCDNLTRALEKTRNCVLPADITVLLAHSPDCINTACQENLDVYLCGHTHGGQICLPGGMPLRKNTDYDWEYCSGPWKKANTTGYTSRGIGTAVVPARFNCPPEITVHTLREVPDTSLT